MTRQMSATRRDGRATFLLEMALDKARMKARLAAVLADERRQRGNGDPRRFPQPEMAALLGYSLRQYQRLEDPDDPSLPTWDDLTAILAKLERDPAEIFADDEELALEAAVASESAATPDPAAAGVEASRELRVLVEALLRAQGIDPAQVLRDERLQPEEPEREAPGRAVPGEAA